MKYSGIFVSWLFDSWELEVNHDGSIYTMHACMFSHSQSCPTLCNPMDCSPPGASVHGIHQMLQNPDSYPHPTVIYPDTTFILLVNTQNSYECS